MKLKNALLIVSLGGVNLLLSSESFAATEYQCKICPSGYYCENGNKYSCQSGYICVNGKKYSQSKCLKSKLVTLTSGSSYTLPAGIYSVELAGGGGGGGGSDKHKKWYGCAWWHCGCDGSRGALNQSQAFSLAVATKLNYTIGQGGAGGGGGVSGYAGTGGTTSISIVADGGTVTATAAGGGGGQNASGDHSFSCPSRAAGNGLGGTGGGRASCGNCKQYNGNVGGAGWITIYKWAC